MRVLLVANPTAQSGKAEEHILHATRALESRGAHVLFVATQAEGRTPKLVSHAINAEGPGLVVGLGGDGTFHEVANGLLRSKAPKTAFGFIPMGTANDQARSFGLGSGAGSIDDNVEVVLGDARLAIDVGQITAKGQQSVLFFDSASFGLGAEILRARNRDRKEVASVPVLRKVYRDQAVYIGAAVDSFVRTLGKNISFGATVITPKKTERYAKLADLLIKATPVYGGAWVFDRSAKVDDGLFEVLPVLSRTHWAMEALGSHVAIPSKMQPWLTQRPDNGMWRTDKLRIQLDVPVVGQLDGEEWLTGSEFEIEVLPRALTLCVPEKPRTSWLPGLRESSAPRQSS